MRPRVAALRPEGRRAGEGGAGRRETRRPRPFETTVKLGDGASAGADLDQAARRDRFQRRGGSGTVAPSAPAIAATARAASAPSVSVRDEAISISAPFNEA